MNSVTLCDHLSPGNPPLTADAAEEKGSFSFWLCGLLLGWFLWYKVTCSMWDAQGHSHSGLPLTAPASIHLAHPKWGLSVALACISLLSSLRPETRHFISGPGNQANLSAIKWAPSLPSSTKSGSYLEERFFQIFSFLGVSSSTVGYSSAFSFVSSQELVLHK